MKKLPVYESRLFCDMRELIEASAERFPNRDAFSYRKHPQDELAARISFPMLRDDIRALGTALAAHGASGHRCALIGRLSYHWACSYFALLAIGAVVVPLDKDWKADALAATAQEADCDFLFCDTALSEKADAILSECAISSPIWLDGAEGENIEALLRAGKERLRRGDRSYFDTRIEPAALAVLVFTSGTTGSGKGVMLSQKNIMSDLYAGLAAVKLSKKTVAVLPPHHTYGCHVGLVAHVAAGSEVYLSDGLRRIQRELRTEKPEHLTLVPLFVETFYRKILSSAREQGKEALLRRMMRASNTLRHVGIDARRVLFQSVLASFGGRLHTVICGGAPISREIISTFDAIGITVINGYGITECSPLVAACHDRYRPRSSGCVGRPLSCNRIKLLNAGPDGEGEICVAGDNVMLGYYRDDAATEAAFTADGYFRTGDIGRFDKDGMLCITGRLKNLIILSNGKNVYPEEIETELSSVPGVLEVVVYEGQSRRGVEHNAIVAEIFPDADLLKKNGIADPHAYFQAAVDTRNRAAVPYQKIGLLKIRDTEFPKNTLRKLLRREIDMSID